MKQLYTVKAGLVTNKHLGYIYIHTYLVKSRLNPWNHDLSSIKCPFPDEKLMKTPFKSNHLRAQDATGAEPEPELPIREVREVLELSGLLVN